MRKNLISVAKMLGEWLAAYSLIAFCVYVLETEWTYTQRFCPEISLVEFAFALGFLFTVLSFIRLAIEAVKFYFAVGRLPESISEILLSRITRKEDLRIVLAERKYFRKFMKRI